jgi:hypothetical protein
VVRFENLRFEHLVDSAWGTHYNLRPLGQGLLVLDDVVAADEDVDIQVQILTQAHGDSLDLLSELSSRSQDESLGLLSLLVNVLESGNGKGCSLARS